MGILILDGWGSKNYLKGNSLDGRFLLDGLRPCRLPHLAGEAGGKM
jgi:hypothetical protein